MNRSSGIVIFSTAYSLCLFAIICCLQIKYDAGAIQNDKLIVPMLKSLTVTPKPKVQYVLMNPVTEEFPVQLAKPSREPSILIASLPAPEALASNNVDTSLTAEPKGAALAKPNFSQVDPAPAEFVDTKQQGLGAWKFFNKVGEQIADSSFSLASNVRFDSKDWIDPIDLQKETKVPAIEPVENASLTRLMNANDPILANSNLEPHLIIANDDESILLIIENLDYLSIIQHQPNTIDNIKLELAELSENGSMDASLCETSLYRILAELDSLEATSSDEDARLIESVKSKIRLQIDNWLDLLNGVNNDTPAFEPVSEEIDYEKLNTAIRSLLWKRMF